MERRSKNQLSTTTNWLGWLPSKKKKKKRERERERERERRGLGTSGTTLYVPTSESYGCQKEKRKSKKLKTYLKK